MKKIAWPASRMSTRLPVLVCAALAVCALAATGASASPLASHGQLLKVGPRLRSNTNTSGNWFGYNQGTLEQGTKLFNSIGGQWTVPTVTQHTAGQAEASSDWIGIGGGCIDAGCTATDSTLIQTGTEQDVSATGQATYDAWYELVPAPELSITSLTVHPGDRMSASISEVVSDSNAWNDHAQGPDHRAVVLDDRSVQLDSRHRGVDRGDAARDRDQRGLRRAPEPLESGIRLRDDERPAGRAQDLRGA